MKMPHVRTREHGTSVPAHIGLASDRARQPMPGQPNKVAAGAAEVTRGARKNSRAQQGSHQRQQMVLRLSSAALRQRSQRGIARALFDFAGAHAFPGQLPAAARFPARPVSWLSWQAFAHQGATPPLLDLTQVWSPPALRGSGPKLEPKHLAICNDGTWSHPSLL